MPSGGFRPGGGRPKGSLTKRSMEIAKQAAIAGTTPLEVMLKAMDIHCKANRWDQAASVAKDAAPYMHPRLASVENTGPGGGPIKYEDVTVRLVKPEARNDH